MQITTRIDARERGLTHYFTGKPCGKGHIDKRYVSTTKCFECNKQKMAARRLKNWVWSTSRDDLQTEKLLRTEARSNDIVTYTSVVPCKRGHLGDRYSGTGGCVECSKNRQAKRHAENREEQNRKRKERRLANIHQERKTGRDYREKNKEEVQRKHTALRRRKRHTDPLFALKHSIRSLISGSINRSGYKKNAKTEQILGCTIHFFKEHLERQFLKGMNWENRHLWHIDHITPVAAAKCEDDIIALNRFTNLRPMWAKDNIAKTDAIEFLI